MNCGYGIQRNLILAIEINEQNNTTQINSDIKYKMVTCSFNCLEIKVPEDEYLSPESDHNSLLELIQYGMTAYAPYWNNNFYPDMKLVSQLNPNILFGIKSVADDEPNKPVKEYYLNGKMICDPAQLVYKYKEQQDILSANPEDWQDWEEVLG